MVRGVTPVLSTGIRVTELSTLLTTISSRVGVPSGAFGLLSQAASATGARADRASRSSRRGRAFIISGGNASFRVEGERSGAGAGQAAPAAPARDTRRSATAARRRVDPRR